MISTLEGHLSFTVCLMEAISEPRLVEQFNRVYGRSLGKRSRSPIEMMVDQTCGYDPDQEDMAEFAKFVREFIWSRLPEETLKEIAKKCMDAVEVKK